MPFTKAVRTVGVLSICNDLTVFNETLKIFLKFCPAAPLVMECADGLMWPAQYVCIVCLLCIEYIITLSCLILSTPLKSSQEQDYIDVNLCKAGSTDWIIYLYVQYKKGGHCSDSCTSDIIDLLCS